MAAYYRPVPGIMTKATNHTEAFLVTNISLQPTPLTNTSKYIVPAENVPLEGPYDNTWCSDRHFAENPTFYGQILTGHSCFATENRFNEGYTCTVLTNKLPLIVIVAS